MRSRRSVRAIVWIKCAHTSSGDRLSGGFVRGVIIRDSPSVTPPTRTKQIKLTNFRFEVEILAHESVQLAESGHRWPARVPGRAADWAWPLAASGQVASRR